MLEAYKLLDSDCGMTLIHYLGDEKMTEQSPHGKSKDTQRNVSRTCPSILSAVKEQCETTSSMKVYRNEITKGYTTLTSIGKAAQRHKTS